MVKVQSDSDEETRCRHMGYSFQLAARVLLYASSQTGYHIPRPLLHQSLSTGSTMKDRSDDPSHHEGTLLPRSYISLRHMVRDNSGSERRNPLPPPPRGLLFLLAAMIFYMSHPTNRIVHTMTFVTPVVEHWLGREVAQRSTLRYPSNERTLYHLATSRSSPVERERDVALW